MKSRQYIEGLISKGNIWGSTEQKVILLMQWKAGTGAVKDNRHLLNVHFSIL
jgi:hypothetical protein